MLGEVAASRGCWVAADDGGPGVWPGEVHETAGRAVAPVAVDRDRDDLRAAPPKYVDQIHAAVGRPWRIACRIVPVICD